MTDKTMRDKIASTISKNITLEDGVFVGGFFDAADAIIAALPDYDAQARKPIRNRRIKELEAALGEFARFASRKKKSSASVPFGQSKLHAAYVVWKGEDK
jgi:hypothetical protein